MLAAKQLAATVANIAINLDTVVFIFGLMFFVRSLIGRTARAIQDNSPRFLLRSETITHLEAIAAGVFKERGHIGQPGHSQINVIEKPFQFLSSTNFSARPGVWMNPTCHMQGTASSDPRPGTGVSRSIAPRSDSGKRRT